MNLLRLSLCSLMLASCTAADIKPDFGGTGRDLVAAFGDTRPGLQRQADTFGFVGQVFSGHVGIDLAAPAGTPVYAAAEGEVTSPGPVTRATANEVVVFGETTVSGTVMSYEFITDIQVTAGERVRAGQLLGYVARENTESDTPHLHFGLADTRGRRLLNPAPLMLDANGQAECVDPARGALSARDGGYEQNRARRVAAGALDKPMLLMPVGC
mgnify:CR=1 FL=1